MTPNSLPELVFPPAELPRAAADQLDVQPYESGLLDLARVHHPSVIWWHGYRKSQDRYGSYCYVCEFLIVTWDRFGGVPEMARRAIDDHKRFHRDGKLSPYTSPNKRKATT